MKQHHGRPLGSSPSGSLVPGNLRKFRPQNPQEAVIQEASSMRIEVAEREAERSEAAHGRPLGVSPLEASGSRDPGSLREYQAMFLPLRHGRAQARIGLAGLGRKPTPPRVTRWTSDLQARVRKVQYFKAGYT